MINRDTLSRLKSPIFPGDAQKVLPYFEDNLFDAVITDPPDELSQSSEASANRVFLKFMFPDDPKIKAKFSGDDELPFLIDKVLNLDRLGDIPGPTTTMPKSTVTFNDEFPGGQHEVEDTSEGSVGVSNSIGGEDGDTEKRINLGSV